MDDGSKLKRCMRIALFSTAAAFIVAGPAYGHWFHGASHLVPRWMMFSGIALNLYEARFETLGPRGTRVRIDRFEELGYDDRWSAPRPVMTFRTKAEARDVARRLCDKRRGEPVFMQLRLARPSGWSLIEDGVRDLCSARRSRT